MLHLLHDLWLIALAVGGAWYGATRVAPMSAQVYEKYKAMLR